MTSTQQAPQTKYRKDYQAPDYTIDTVDLDFHLGEDGTLVDSKMRVLRNGDHARPLILDGEELETLKVSVDGQEWPASQVQIEEEKLTIEGLPADCRPAREPRVERAGDAEVMIPRERAVLAREATSRVSAEGNQQQAQAEPLASTEVVSEGEKS